MNLSVNVELCSVVEYPFKIEDVMLHVETGRTVLAAQSEPCLCLCQPQHCSVKMNNFIVRTTMVKSDAAN